MITKMVVNYDGVDKFVSEQTAAGNDVYWQGWDLVFFKENANGFNDKNGAFRNGQWGVQTTVQPDSNGLWRIPVKYVNTRRTRN